MSIFTDIKRYSAGMPHDFGLPFWREYVRMGNVIITLKRGMDTMEEIKEKKRMLSGIKPSGDLTLGSYLGAIKNWAERSEEYVRCGTRSDGVSRMCRRLCREREYDASDAER